MSPGQPPTVEPVRVAYRPDEAVTRRLRIGLVVVATDLTIERDFRRFLHDLEAGVYVTRVSYANPMTLENLGAMRDGLVDAARLILPGERLDALGYACTSGAVAMGVEVAQARIAEARPGVPGTDPITAAREGFRHLGVRRIALLTPYRESVTDPIRRCLESYGGLGVTRVASFGLDSDVEVAHLPTDAIVEAACELDGPEAEGLFISCTGMRSAEVAETIEDRVGKPVLTSNQALAWHALRLAGHAAPIAGHGRLLRSPAEVESGGHVGRIGERR